MKKLLALLMVCTLVLSLAACGGKPSEDETTTAEETTTVLEDETTAQEPATIELDLDDTTVQTTEAPTEAITDSTTVAPTEVTTKAEVTTAAPETTTAASAVAAPVGSDVAKIVAFYNESANAAKAYKGKVKIAKDEQKKSTITEFSVGMLKGLANDMLAKAMGDKKHKEDTFTNGKGANGNDIKKFIPLDGQTVMSKLPASGVKTATCTKDGNNFKIKMKLKQEVVGCNQEPPNHSKVMGTLTVTDDDVSPFVLVKDKTSFTYTGATVEATVNQNGQLIYVHFYEPCIIKGTLKKGVSVDAVVDGSWEQSIWFTY